MTTLSLYRRAVSLLGPRVGKWVFATGVCIKAPYFLTIRPSILKLEPGDVIISIPDSRLVHNHLSTTHAIAQCNLIECVWTHTCSILTAILTTIRIVTAILIPSFERYSLPVCSVDIVAMGMAAEVSLPSHLRWIPMGMDVRYLAPGNAPLIATCEIDPETHFELDEYPGVVSLPVTVRNAVGKEISTADIRLWISKRKGNIS